MKMYVIAVGAKMPDWVNIAWDDYAKRLPPEWTVVLKEIKPEPRTTGKTVAQMMSAEAKRIEAAIPSDALRIALDEHGKDLSTKSSLYRQRLVKMNLVSRTKVRLIMCSALRATRLTVPPSG